MNPTVRLGKLYYESSIGVPALLPCSQLPRQARGTLKKIDYLTSLSGLFCHLVYESRSAKPFMQSGHGAIFLLCCMHDLDCNWDA